MEYIRHNNYGPVQAREEYATEHEYHVSTTPLEGKAIDVKSRIFWLVLKDLTLRGPAFAYISHLDQLRHGRAAIKALRANYEGNLAMSQTKAQVYNTIKTASYSGEKHNWTFKMYVTIHQKSHQILEEYGKLVPPAKQVRDLINRIDRSNRMMAAALATLLATNNLREDFQAASGYLCNFVAANKSKNQARNISGVGSGGWGGAGRGHSGGRGSGWGRGCGQNGQNYNKKELSAQSYTTEEWGQLMYEQKESVRKPRLAYKRQASAVSSITAQNNNETGNQSSVTHAGNQFAKINKKKKGGIDN